MAAQETNVTVDFTNQALIQDEILLAICLVLEHGWPAGPIFLHALNTLIETVVVHDVVYFDPLYQFRREQTYANSIPAILRHSNFVNLLVGSKPFVSFPQRPLLMTTVLGSNGITHLPISWRKLLGYLIDLIVLHTEVPKRRLLGLSSTLIWFPRLRNFCSHEGCCLTL